jgi:hypothetical protein
MRKSGIVFVLIGVAWLVGQQTVPPLAAQQSGGLPALETNPPSAADSIGSLRSSELGSRRTIAEQLSPFSCAGEWHW